MNYELLGWYASIFFWLFFTGLGIPPCPEEAGILYAAGLTALHEEVKWYVAWPLTGAGIVCADIVMYAVGRFWGHKLFEHRWARWMLKPERRLRLEKKFHDHGIKLLIAARFLPPLRTGVFLIAGAIRYSFPKFLLADATFAVFGVGALFFCGTWLVPLLHAIGTQALIFAVPVVVVALFVYYRFLKKREMKGEPIPPVSVVEVALPPAEPPPAQAPASREQAPAAR